MKEFDAIFNKLNSEQKAAVNTIDGPLLVLAGPGTGKTQLLGARIANILTKTDTLPSNILALTFTESGAMNMRERLSSMIGPQAYDVTISTYHSFGSDIIKSYPEFFEQIGTDRTDDVRMERPIDRLNQVQIVAEIIEKLDYTDPMLTARYYVKSVVSTLSELKQALLSPYDLEELAVSNIQQIASTQPLLNEVVNASGGISRKKAEYLNQYEQLVHGLANLDGELIDQAADEITDAYKQALEDKSSKPLTAWKNTWLHKDEDDNFTFTKRSITERMLALAGVYASYEKALKSNGLYDFDDMILRSIEAIRDKDELRFNLQEKYQYILLDEFQDTNPAQFELVHQIADHPVHEGRPNIMAVGDDDQAIYAFQGANVGNMQKFIDSYRDTTVINLTKNYRSHHDIIHTAHNISAQIEDRLHHSIEGIEKTLEAQGDNLPEDAAIERHEFNSQASEYGWISERINKLVESGVAPHEIAVLSPKHRLLESLVPFINKYKVPVSYDKRENILQTPIVESLKIMAELVLALQNRNIARTNQLFPIALSMPFWNFPVQEIWKINWQHAKRDELRSWAEIALDNEVLAEATLYFLAMSNQDALAPLENTLDALTGTTEVKLSEDSYFTSPLKEHYFDASKQQDTPLSYFETISHLSVIRSKLRDHQASEDNKLTLKGFIEFFDMYEVAGESLINSHPVAQADSAIQLMTAYKSKGLEFEYVFILSAHDDVWGSRARGGSNKLSLSENLKHIRYAGSSEDELRRLLFVAITRAKHGLFLTSHAYKDSGKRNEPVKYLNEADGITGVLPESKQTVNTSDMNTEMLSEHIETLWLARHTTIDTTLRSLLKDRLAKYQMSPTHVNSFTDLDYGGPQAFLLNTLLRFPQAPSIDGEYGTAIHNTLEWYQNRINNGDSVNLQDALNFYEKELKRRYISEADIESVTEKGKNTLERYIDNRQAMFSASAKTEVNFYAEGVLIGDAHLSGKIDRLEVDEKNKIVRIADYKTGSSFKTWRCGSELKHLKYEQQLYIYKLLIEGSNTYKGYTVESARLEFVEPDRSTGVIVEPLLVVFDDKKEEELKQLIQAVWEKITTLDLPDVSEFGSGASGARKFIRSLID